MLKIIIHINHIVIYIYYGWVLNSSKCMFCLVLSYKCLSCFLCCIHFICLLCMFYIFMFYCVFMCVFIYLNIKKKVVNTKNNT